MLEKEKNIAVSKKTLSFKSKNIFRKKVGNGVGSRG
jgi:hypothetical protein